MLNLQAVAPGRDTIKICSNEKITGLASLVVFYYYDIGDAYRVPAAGKRKYKWFF